MRFVAALDTAFYGVRYAQGVLVDTTGWSRKQLLQFLDKGLIAPADLNGTAVSEIRLGDLSNVAEDTGDDGQVLTLVSGRWQPADPSDSGSTSYADQLMYDHVHSSEPHPAYDDIPSLTLLFENGLV